MPNTLQKVHNFRVLLRIAASWGLLLMVTGPLLWGLLPIGYGVLNSNDAIQNNSLFTVFMRMTTSFVLTAFCAMCIWLWFGVLDRKEERKKEFRDLCLETGKNVKTHLGWLVLLFLCYFGARAVEMSLILTYSLDKSEIVTTVSETRHHNSYLGTTQISGDSDQYSAIKERTTNALKDYGYFMGLMLALLLAIKNHALYGKLSKVLNRRWPSFSRNLTRLQGGRMTLVGWIFWLSTLFLTIASGVLYIAAKEPLYVWPFIVRMTVFACFVALFTSFGTDCTILGNLDVGRDSENCPAWKSALVASITMNLIQSAGTALFALVFWFFSHPGGENFTELAGQYFVGLNGFMLIVVIGLLGSVIAPVSQLFGVNLHDAILKNRGMNRYGVSGSDWLRICGGFEPLFVVLLGWMVPILGLGLTDSEGSLINYCPMLIAVLTVAVIALLKIAEVWSEKNSVLRNAIFAKVRGSTQDTHENESLEELYERAVKLSFLKFYDKRHKLSAFETRLTEPALINTLGLPLQALPEVYLAFIVNGQHFFAQDDPFTNDVLRSHELYLTRRFPDVELVSLKRYLVNGGRISTTDWKSVVRPAVRTLATKDNIVGDDAMPYVLVAKDKAKANACAKEWSELLQMISKAVKSGELDEYVNGMIVQMKSE